MTPCDCYRRCDYYMSWSRGSHNIQYLLYSLNSSFLLFFSRWLALSLFAATMAKMAMKRKRMRGRQKAVLCYAPPVMVQTVIWPAMTRILALREFALRHQRRHHCFSFPIRRRTIISKAGGRRTD